MIHGEKVLLDADLALLYGIDIKFLTRAMKHNIDRFPDDFMFQISKEKFNILRNQSGTSSEWGGRRYPPYAFTEQGVAMLSSILRSKQAIEVNIQIIRTFVKLRQMLDSNEKLAKKLSALEKKYDDQFKIVFKAIRELMIPPEPNEKKQIGFIWYEEKKILKNYCHCERKRSNPS